jgi:hypothetical protein
MSKTLGVATTKAEITSGTITGATINNSVIGGTTPVAGTFTTVTATNVVGALDGVLGGVTPAAATVTALTATGNVALGNAITDTIGLYGVTPIAQRAGAAQATSLVGTASSADVTTDMKAALIEVMTTLQVLGLWKGAA